jgi:formiminoglutamase
MNRSLYNFSGSELWMGRNDSIRFHNKISVIAIDKLTYSDSKGIAFIGFASDEGVKRNNGREGAREGPDVLRTSLASFPVHFIDELKIVDVGTVSCVRGDLEGAQKYLGEVIAHVIKCNYLPLVFGGGHEVAWGHYLGLAQSYSLESFGVINFDAHYDLRPLLEGGKGSSGTPFRQIAEDRKKKDLRFDYLCVGIQNFGNSIELFDAASKYGVESVLATQIESAEKKIEEFISRNKQVYITLCLDLFSEAHAPGVSSPQPLGVFPQQVVPLVKKVASSGKVIGFDVAELCPRLDFNNRTARLGASLVASFISSFKN